jgi:hypothetical protein
MHVNLVPTIEQKKCVTVGTKKINKNDTKIKFRFHPNSKETKIEVKILMSTLLNTLP